MIILNLLHMENNTYLCHGRTSKIKIHLLRLFESRRAVFRFMPVRCFPTFTAFSYHILTFFAHLNLMKFRIIKKLFE